MLAELHRGPDDRGKLEKLIDLSRRSNVPLAAAGDVHYHVPERAALCDTLAAIRHGCTVTAAREHFFPNAAKRRRDSPTMATTRQTSAGCRPPGRVDRWT